MFTKIANVIPFSCFKVIGYTSVLLLCLPVSAGVLDHLKDLLIVPEELLGDEHSVRAVTSDRLVLQSQISQPIQVDLLFPTGQCEPAGQAQSSSCSIPQINISYSLGDGWQPLTPDIDLSQIEAGHQYFSITLPGLTVQSVLVSIVIRVQLVGDRSTEMRFLVGVLPEHSVDIYEVAGYDLDGTLVAENARSDLINFVANSIKGHLQGGRLIAYITARREEDLQFTRNWLLSKKQEPGFIFAIPKAIDRHNHELTRHFKQAVLRQLTTITSLKAYWGNSAMIDAEAAILAGVERVHLLQNDYDVNGDPKELEVRLPANYKKYNQRKMTVITSLNRYQTIQHTYVRTGDAVVAGPVTAVPCLPPVIRTVNKSRNAVLPAHLAMECLQLRAGMLSENK